MGIILNAQSLSYCYENKTKALYGASLSIKEGERLAILGSNGSGKSTLFLCLNGVIQPKEGTILLDGVPVGRDRRSLQSLRENVGIVFQDPETQLFCVDVWQEIAFGPFNQGKRAQVLEETVEHTIRRMELESFRVRPPHTLSTGQKKRVSIAAVLAMKPRVLIFDEPTGSLDPYHTEQLMRLLDELHQEGMTLVISTHDMDFAWGWADRVAIMQEGAVAAQGDPAKIFSDPLLLEQTGLCQPVLLRIFLQLVRNRLLPEDTVPPRTLADLEHCLRKGYGKHEG